MFLFEFIKELSAKNKQPKKNLTSVSWLVLWQYMLPPSKLKFWSGVSSDVGQVFFASMFVGPFLSGAINWPVIISGLGLSFVFWITGSLLVKE